MYTVKIGTDESFKNIEVKKIIDTSFLIIRVKVQNFVDIHFSLVHPPLLLGIP
jgi:hypothetical protein